MNLPEPADNAPRAHGREIIHCVRCDVENLAGATRCHECGAHLYLACRACGEGNLRSRRTCSKCGARLGRSAVRRLKDKLFRRFSPVETLLGLAVLAVLIVLMIRLVIAVASLEPPSEEEDPEYDHTVPSTDPGRLPRGTETEPRPG